MINVIILAVVLLLVGGAIAYIIKAKKKGVTCIGCPAGGHCSGKCNGSCSTAGNHGKKN